MDKHTPGPWEVGRGTKEALFSWGGQIIAKSDDGDYFIIVSCNQNYPKLAEANARRIVACVNACEGIPTAILEGDSTEKRDWKAVYADNATLTARVNELQELLVESLYLLCGGRNNPVAVIDYKERTKKALVEIEGEGHA